MTADVGPQPELYVITAQTSAGFRRRLFLVASSGSDGSAGAREVAAVAGRLSARGDEMAECRQSLERVAEERDLLRVAR